MSASNIDAAATFLELLDPDADSFTFQTFDDNEELKRRHLTKVLHGSLADQAQRLAALQKGGAGVFVTISETDFAGRKKVNITRARAVFVDLDGAPLKPVLTCTLEPHIIVESSPGRWHAYWIAEGLTLDQFEGVQKALVARFKGDSACVDCSRVMRLPGFYHQKGAPFLTRIHGMSDRLPYKAEQILAEFPPVKAAGCKAKGGAEGGEDRETSDLIRGIMTGEEYHPALLRLAWRYASAGWSRTQIINALQGFMDARTDRDARWTARRKQIPMLVDTAIKKQEADRDAQDQPARKMLDRLAADHDEAEAAENAPEAIIEIKGDAEFDFSHDGLALDMGWQWARRARHVAPWGQWLFWDGARWVPDVVLLHLTRTRNYLRARADRLVRDVKSGKFMPDNQDRDHALKVAEAVAKTLRQAATIAAVSGLARSNAELAANVDQWDADPWLLGTPSGTVDLRTGIMRKPSAEDYITKITMVAPGGEPVRWLAFLDRITNGDVDLQSYLQRFAGYALTGSTREHTFNYGHGTGANGKSVWIEALKGILGEYACSFPTEMLMVTQNDRHPTEIARMRGCRLAIGSETEEGRQWAENKIKTLTGGDTVAARFMHKDFFEYQPQFKLFIVGNHKPGLRCVDEAMRRRLHFVPFLVTIPPEERDKDLSAKLQEEWPAILRWAIDGCLAWQQQGLNPPECVQVATNEYLSSEDAFEVWRAECLIEDKNAWSSSKDLWKSWKQWAEAAGEFVGKQRALSDRLLQIGCKSYAHPRTRARGYRGLQIQPTDGVKVAPWAA